MDQLQQLEYALNHMGVGPLPGGRWDAKFTAALSRQLEFVKARTFDIVFPEMKGRRLFPLSTEVDSGAQTITYEQWDSFGMANVIANYADDIAESDVLVEEFTSKVKGIASSYKFSIQDLRASAMADSNLQSRKAMAARRSIENRIEDVAAFGITNGGITGALNNASIPITAAPNGTWTLLTPGADIIEDLNTLVDAIVVANKETFLPDTLIVPTEKMSILSQKAVSTTGDTGTTILRQFLDNNPYINSIESWFKLRTAGAGGIPRLMAYKKSPEVMSLEIPQDFESFPPQPKNLAFKVPVHARVAGVIVYYPLAAGYMDGT